MGMGSYSISGKYLVEVLDYKAVLDEYPDLEVVKEFEDEEQTEWVVYNDYVDNHFEDLVNDVMHKTVSQCELEFEHVDITKYIPLAALEFVKLCNYIQDIKMTTLFDGVNENGVIVTYGKGSHLDTYTDAYESDEVELLIKHNIPIVFHNSITGEYYQFHKEPNEKFYK